MGNNKFVKVRGQFLSLAYFISCLILIVIQLSTVELLKRAPHNKAFLKRPNIWLKGYQKIDSINLVAVENDFRFQDQVQNEFITKNGSNIFLTENVNAVDFTCEANYPVTWSFPFPKQIPTIMKQQLSIQEHRISELFSDTSEPVNIRYKTTIRITCLYINFLSLNLTCKSAENKLNIESSIYVFLTGKDEIEHQNETLQVFAQQLEYIYGQTAQGPPVLLPCRPATPDLKVSLQKEIHGDSTQKKSWEPLYPALQENLSFDPKFGFTLRRNSHANIIFGLYKCSITDDDGNEYTGERGNFVLINVTATSNDTLNYENSPTLTFQPKAVLHGKASAIVEISRTPLIPETVVLCCSGHRNNPPKLYIKTCRDPVQCDLVKNSISGDIASGKAKKRLISNFPIRAPIPKIPNDCKRERLFSDNSVVVVCQGENVDYADHLIPFFHPLASGSVANRTNRILGPNFYQDLKEHSKRRYDLLYVPLDKYDTATIIENDNILARKMILVVGQRLSSTKDVIKVIHRRTSLNDRLANYGIATYFTNTDIENAYNAEPRLVKKPNQVVEYLRDYYYEGEPLLVGCIGVKFAYSKGAYLRLNWNNGTKSLLKETVSEQTTNAYQTMASVYLSGNAFLGASGFARGYYFVSGNTILAASSMSSVDCWMPQRNSRKWDKISKRIQVIPTVAPVFSGKEDETKIFYIGDVGHVITCTLEKGTPPPIMSVTRNGKALKVSLLLAGNNYTQRIDPKDGTSQAMLLDKNMDATEIKIYFPVIEHGDHDSVFQCIAANLNKTTARTIRISVNEKTETKLVLSITFSCLTVVGLILTVLGVKHFYNKRRG